MTTKTSQNQIDAKETDLRNQRQILNAQIEFLRKWCQCVVERLIADKIPVEGTASDNSGAQPLQNTSGYDE